MATEWLFTADLHLVDTVQEEYRWGIFDTLEAICQKIKIDIICIAGDATDRKDRHPGALVNRFVSSLEKLQKNTNARIVIIAGNHDQPLKPPYFWDFLNKTGIQYITKPTLVEGVFLLPYADNPVQEWKELKLEEASAIIMHQTVAGSRVEGDFVIEHAPHPVPIFPRGVPVYSGDVHRPQEINGVTYIGVPHPTRFGETWPNRVLHISSDSWHLYDEIPIVGVRRAILDIDSAAALNATDYKKGDQLRIRYKLTNDTLSSWPVEELAIYDWARSREVAIISLEASLEAVASTTITTTGSVAEATIMPPADLLRAFSQSEKLAPEVVEFGLNLLQECRA